MIRTVICPYCKKPAELTTGKTIYPHKPKLYYLKLYACMPCSAYVGTHKNSGAPLGRLADKELRSLKLKAHAHFDRLWQDKHMSRKEAYALLAKSMRIQKRFCHIGMFNNNQCLQVVDFSKAKLLELLAVKNEKLLNRFRKNHDKQLISTNHIRRTKSRLD